MKNKPLSSQLATPSEARYVLNREISWRRADGASLLLPNFVNLSNILPNSIANAGEIRPDAIANATAPPRAKY